MNSFPQKFHEGSSAADEAAMAQRFAALANPARIRILRHLAATSSCCCGEVVEQFDLAQSTVSQHLKVLVSAGLVNLIPDGQRSLYCIDAEAMTLLSTGLSDLAKTCCRDR
jgi:ArsR family transcriptional regulator